MDSNTLIQIQNVRKTYFLGDSKIEALSDISLKIHKGEFLSIMGKSGSGKSTLLNVMGGLDSPTQGSVYIDNHEITKMTETKLSVFRRRNIGYVFQFFNLIPELTLRENILFPLLLEKEIIDESYFQFLCGSLEIEDRLHHLPSQVSGGQQQRAAIARSLILKPQVVLLDEPTGNLDEESSLSVLKLIRRVSLEINQTVVLITHDSEAAAYGNRLVIIKDGKIDASH